MEYDSKQLELLIQKESSSLEGRLRNFSEKQKNIVNWQVSWKSTSESQPHSAVITC